MKKVKLTKISDDFFDGNHPNSINVGYEVEGAMQDHPTIGSRFTILKEKEYLGKPVMMGIFSTSPVTSKLDENNEFKTTYSTYKIEYLDESVK